MYQELKSTNSKKECVFIVLTEGELEKK